MSHGANGGHQEVESSPILDDGAQYIRVCFNLYCESIYYIVINIYYIIHYLYGLIYWVEHCSYQKNFQ